MTSGWPAAASRLDVPVFPLPKLVLFPGTLLPLHIFEPRYRDMLGDSLASKHRMIAVAQLKPGWEHDYGGRPAIYDIAGVGEISQHRRNEDGTYDIVLEAMARVRLDESLPNALRYRRASATLLEERSADAAVSGREVIALFGLAQRISAVVQRALPGFALHASSSDSPALLSDRLADQFVLDPAARQELLETLDVGERIHSLMVQLSQLHLALCSSESGNTPTTLH